MPSRGKYIVIEGNDGTGKSSQVEKLQEKLTSLGIESIQIHEPDGVPISAKLREIIKDGTLERDGKTNIMLFTAARHENWRQQMEPALASGKWVLSARSWISTVAYQGYGEGNDVEFIKRVTQEFVGDEYLRPDVEIVLSLTDEAVRKSRISNRGELDKPDTFESRADDFQTKVNDGYFDFAKLQNIQILDASGTIDEVENSTWNIVKPLTKETA